MILRRWTTALLGCLFTVTACAEPPTPRPADRVPEEWPFEMAGPPAATASSGMVVTDASLATRVGLDVLRSGGNAVDATVATAFALAVVYPEAGNIGGGGFMVLRTGADETAALDFREEAPLAATPDMFLDDEGELTDRSITGHLASGVPGAVAGLWAAHQRYGTMPWADLVAPAIRLADRGFEVDSAFSRVIRGRAETLAEFPASARLFLGEDGEAPEPGSRWRNPDLAATLRRIAEEGPDDFYRGRTAELIVDEMQRGGGLITAEGLARYEPEWREPVAFDYRGHTVLSMPPASSGGITLAMMANIAEGYDMRGLGWHSPEALHVTAEAMRRAFADRNHYLGDSDFVEIPRERLVSERYAAMRRRSISPRRASRSSRITHGTGADGTESMHTTHLSIVDADGNAVALTTTINFLFGSKVTVAGAGFPLNNEMDDFTAKPGEPNAFGLVQGKANAVEPGKRMLSAMTPTIVLDSAGAPLLVTGARGGPRIINAVFQVMSNVIDYGMELRPAVNAPRIHHQHLPDVLYVEPDGFTPFLIERLRDYGHDVRVRSGYVATAPSLLRAGDIWTGVPDPRTGGLAAGY